MPANLEGAYRLDLRGADEAGHLGPAEVAAWEGSVDTVGPRVALTRTLLSNGTFRYLTTAQDFNLADAAFNSPCGAGVATLRLDYDAPWYRNIFGNAQRLNSLTADCTLPGYVTNNAVGAYDTAGLAQGVAVTGTLALVADGVAGLQIIDVSEPASPTLLSNVSGIPSARGVALASYPIPTTTGLRQANPAQHWRPVRRPRAGS